MSDFTKLAGTIALFLLASFVGCGRGILASNTAAREAVIAHGFTDVKVTDHAWFAVGLRGCDEKDAARFTVAATNPKGDRVTLVVCSGVIFKGATIRGAR